VALSVNKKMLESCCVLECSRIDFTNLEPTPFERRLGLDRHRTQQASLTVNLESSATKKPVVLDLEYKILNVIFDACGWEFCSLEQVEDIL
jgi:hypothetical protein